MSTPTKLPKPNVTKQEKAALVNIMKDPTVMVLPADKGKATVLMDTQEYENKVNIMLQDERTYEQLPSDPTPKYKHQLISILSNLRKDNKLTEAEYRFFYPTSETTPQLYCTPKIHKKDNPLRPIVDYTDVQGLGGSAGPIGRQDKTPHKKLETLGG